MDAAVFATLSTAALGVALSPLVLIEIILINFSERRVVNSIVFVVSLALLTAGTLALGAWTGAAEQSAGSSIGTVVSVVLALALIAVGVQNFRRRHDATPPKILDSISGMKAWATVALALGAIAFNPKNLPLLLSAGAMFTDIQWPVATGVAVVIVAIAPCLAIVLYGLFGGERATGQLDRLRSWLLRRNRLIMTILCLGLGSVLLVKAIFGN